MLCQSNATFHFSIRHAYGKQQVKSRYPVPARNPQNKSSSNLLSTSRRAQILNFSTETVELKKKIIFLSKPGERLSKFAMSCCCHRGKSQNSQKQISAAAVKAKTAKNRFALTTSCLSNVLLTIQMTTCCNKHHMIWRHRKVKKIAWFFGRNLHCESDFKQVYLCSIQNWNWKNTGWSSGRHFMIKI